MIFPKATRRFCSTENAPPLAQRWLYATLATKVGFHQLISLPEVWVLGTVAASLSQPCRNPPGVPGVGVRNVGDLFPPTLLQQTRSSLAMVRCKRSGHHTSDCPPPHRSSVKTVGQPVLTQLTWVWSGTCPQVKSPLLTHITWGPHNLPGTSWVYGTTRPKRSERTKMKWDVGPRSLLCQLNTARNKCKSQSERNCGIKYLLDDKKKKKPKNWVQEIHSPRGIRACI